MSDLLSASSLLLAIAAILFSLWHPEITSALKIIPENHKEDNVGARAVVTSVIVSKALPVAVVSLAVTLIFLPDAIRLTKESFEIFQKIGYSVVKNYDAVRTAYCFVTLLSAVLALYVWVLLGKLFFLHKRLG
jgi:hypothetical protein